MVRDCPEERRETGTPTEPPTVEAPTPVTEGASVPSSASVVEGGARRARSRPPVVREPARLPSEGPVEAEYVELLREEVALKNRLA
eukprot:3932161-Prorocentrum_lima.AAC.1